MLDVQDFLILGSGMGLLTNLIVLGNFLLKGKTRRQKSINRGFPNKGVEPEDLGVSLQGCWRAEVVPTAGESQSCAVQPQRAQLQLGPLYPKGQLCYAQS